jgi:RNA polymerase sigma-70 factor (ECF subfamily)
MLPMTEADVRDGEPRSEVVRSRRPAVATPRSTRPAAPAPVISVADALADAEADLAAFAAWTERGDREALHRVFSRHAEAALRLAQHRLGNFSDADDAVQHAFVGVMRGARNFNPDKGTVRGYLLAAVLNACAQQRRSEASRRAREEVADPPRGVGADPELRDAVKAALSKLPAHQREPVELRYLAGLEFAEIALALGRNERTVRGQVTRGLDSLRQMSARYGLAVSTSAVALALAALSPPASGAEAVRRCAVAARRGPRAASSFNALHALAIAGGVAALIALIALLWPRGHALAQAETPPAPALVEAAPAPAIASQPAVSAPAPTPAPAFESGRLWSMHVDVDNANLFPALAVGSARLVDDGNGGVRPWTQTARRASGAWAWDQPAHGAEHYPQLTPTSLLSAPHVGEIAYLLCPTPALDGAVCAGLKVSSLLRDEHGWTLCIDGLRLPRTADSVLSYNSRGIVIVELGPWPAGDQHIAVELHWRDASPRSLIVSEGGEVERGELLVPASTRPDGPPLTLASFSRAARDPAVPRCWWQVPLDQGPFGLTSAEAPPELGGLVTTSESIRTAYVAAGNAMRDDVMLVLGPPVASPADMALRTVRWDHGVATITMDVYTHRNEADLAGQRRPLVAVMLERPSDSPGRVSVRLVWQHFLADRVGGTYALQSGTPSFAGTTRLDDVSLPEPRR